MNGQHMKKEQPGIDITNLPEVARLAEEVRASHTPRVLRRGNEVIARIVSATPLRATLPRQRHGHGKTKEDMEAFLASAGSWKGLVDGEQLKKDIKEARGSDREFQSLWATW
jgi:hypothetical protein